jgi:hypothetical protein
MEEEMNGINLSVRKHEGKAHLKNLDTDEIIIWKLILNK